MNDVLDIAFTDIDSRETPLADELADGRVVVLRQVPALDEVRRQLIATAAGDEETSTTAAELEAFYDEARPPSIRAVHGLAQSVKAARDERFLSECLAPLVRTLGLPGPVLVDGGISRLVLPGEVVEETRRHADLFEATDYRRERADGPTETFMPGPSNIHRDFDRDHHLLMCNIWFPLHDTTCDESIQIYPTVYREPVHSRQNKVENRSELGPRAEISLRFGDCVVFHSENMHHSPNSSRGGRRHSYDFRIAAGCPDDNRHYRYNFVSLDDFRDASSTLPVLAGEPTIDGPVRSANEVRRHLERVDPAEIDWARVELLYKEFPFAAGRYLDLAERAADIAPDVASRALEAVVQHSDQYFFVLQAAEAMSRRTTAATGLARACDRVVELASRGEPRRFAPVEYDIPGQQLMPDAAIARARELAAGHVDPADDDTPHEVATSTIWDRLVRLIPGQRRSA